MNDGQLVIFTVGMTLDQLEKMAILKAVQHFRNNKTTTANSLGIAIRTLDNKLERYALEEEEMRQRQADEQSRREEFLLRARGTPPNNVGIPFTPNQSLNHDSYERHFPSTPAGSRMESIANASSQQAMPLSERKQVQTVLPPKATESSKGKGR